MAERLVAPGLGVQVSPGEADADSASLGQRLLAYLLDSIVLFAFSMLFATASFLYLFRQTDYGRGAVTDSVAWTSVVILMLAIPAWVVFNLLLAAKRGQTVGQYVLGLGVVTSEEGDPTARRLLTYWLALHPLLFHPFFAGLWVLFGFMSGLSLSQNEALLVLFLAVALLCVVAPLAGLLFALADPQHRAIHDRIAGVKVVRVS
jgi:uncharacterized RDD family membrane protein YckC